MLAARRVIRPRHGVTSVRQRHPGAAAGLLRGGELWLSRRAEGLVRSRRSLKLLLGVTRLLQRLLRVCLRGLRIAAAGRTAPANGTQALMTNERLKQPQASA